MALSSNAIGNAVVELFTNGKGILAICNIESRKPFDCVQDLDMLSFVNDRPSFNASRK